MVSSTGFLGTRCIFLTLTEMFLPVRVSAKELTSLILDEERLRTERQDRKIWKSRVTGIEEFGPNSAYGEGGTPPPRRRTERRDQRADEEDAEYRLAIEASKHEAEEDRKRRERNSNNVDDDDLAKAIKLSKEEEELRRRELEESNPSAVFDDTPTPTAQPQYTGYNQGYQQQSAVDWDGNTIDQQPAQLNMTGYLNNAYSNPTGFQSQQTGFQTTSGFPNGFQSSQNIFDPQPFSQQPQQQGLLQSQSPTYTNFNNPYANAGGIFGGPMEQQQQGGFLPTGSNNPWASSQAQHSQLDALKPLPTGSNNPFVSSLSRPQPQQSNTAPSLNTLTEQKVQTEFNNHNFNPAMSFAGTNIHPPKEQNPQHARLNALLAAGEGMDTFGNTGELRIPAQHTAPGTFVNSAGSGLTRLNQTQTGNNPFFQQQFTGVPQSTGFSSGPGYGQQPNRLLPAQTGPAHMNGFGSNPNNPFGQTQTHRQPQQQSGSLIDL